MIDQQKVNDVANQLETNCRLGTVSRVWLAAMKAHYGDEVMRAAIAQLKARPDDTGARLWKLVAPAIVVVLVIIVLAMVMR